MRASYYLLGALLGKYNHAEVSLPGGCNLGTRAIDQHMKGFKLLGASVDIEDGKIVTDSNKLAAGHIAQAKRFAFVQSV